MQSCAELVDRIATPMLEELRAVAKLVNDHFKVCVTHGHSLTSTTSTDDCLMLYSLIRHFGCQHAFEVGTYIGATAVAMNAAIRKNGGICTTCDPIDFGALPPWSGIRFIKAGSSIALRTLYEEARSIDFVFLDWMPDSNTLELIPKTCTGDTIFAVHDYVDSDPKGRQVVAALGVSPDFCKRDGQWFAPDASPRDVGGIKLNAATAFFVPNRLLSR